jgi:hypothetical protein
VTTPGWELEAKPGTGVPAPRACPACARHNTRASARDWLDAAAGSWVMTLETLCGQPDNDDSGKERPGPAWLQPQEEALHAPHLSCQRLEQRLGLLQVSGVKALGEPAVDRCEQVIGLLAFALLLP